MYLSTHIFFKQNISILFSKIEPLLVRHYELSKKCFEDKGTYQRSKSFSFNVMKEEWTLGKKFCNCQDVSSRCLPSH